MERFKALIITISIHLMVQIVFAEPTAKTYIFAASQYMFYHYEPFSGAYPLDSLARHFDVIIFHDQRRDTIPTIRDSTMVEWRREKAPTLLMYKDAMTIHWDDIPCGGGMSVGGFWHFDSIFFGYGSYSPDTFL